LGTDERGTKCQYTNPARGACLYTLSLGCWLLGLEKGRNRTLLLMETEDIRTLSNYIRVHRKKSGLNQHELSMLLGYIGDGQVARHERSLSLPTLTTALAYEVIFRVPVADLFPATRERAQQDIDERIQALKGALEQRSGKGRYAPVTARKLEWIAMRYEST